MTQVLTATSIALRPSTALHAIRPLARVLRRVGARMVIVWRTVDGVFAGAAGAPASGADSVHRRSASLLLPPR